MTPLHLHADPDAPGAARRWLTGGIAGQDIPDDVGFSALLLTSELVTNAVIHARSAVTVVLQLRPGSLRIEVSDDDPTAPRPRDGREAAVAGRGLRIVDALAARWGVTSHDGRGKTVWFELMR